MSKPNEWQAWIAVQLEEVFAGVEKLDFDDPDAVSIHVLPTSEAHSKELGTWVKQFDLDLVALRQISEACATEHVSIQVVEYQDYPGCVLVRVGRVAA